MPNRVRASLVALLALVALAPPLARAQAPAEKELMDLENHWGEATVTGDVQALERLYADEYLAIDPAGATFTKAQDIANVKSGNFKLATYAKRLGIKVLFYVSPQVWAWRPGRVRQYGRVIDMMAVIFPFETAYYEVENVPVRYVGHPSVDKVRPQYDRSEDFARFGLSAGKPVVGLLPGSRSGEIRRMLPVMLKSAETIAARVRGAQFVLPQAGSTPAEHKRGNCPQAIKEVESKNQ